MSWSRIATSTYMDYPTGTTIDLPAINIAAGDTLVAMVYAWDSITVSNIRDSDGSTNTMTRPTVYNAEGIYAQAGYLLSATAKSGAVMRVTISAVPEVGGVIIILYQLRASAGTVSVDRALLNATGTANTIATGQFSTTGTDTIVVAFSAMWDAATLSSELIAAGAADYYNRMNDGSADWCAGWMRAFTSAQTNITAQETKSGTTGWVISAIAFKAETEAATGQPMAKRLGGIKFNAFRRVGVW